MSFFKSNHVSFPVDRSLAKDVSAIELRLSLVPDGTIQIVTEEDAAVVFGVGRGDRRKAPLHVEGKIRELVVKAQPLVAAVAVTDSGRRAAAGHPFKMHADRRKRSSLAALPTSSRVTLQWPRCRATSLAQEEWSAGRKLLLQASSSAPVFQIARQPWARSSVTGITAGCTTLTSGLQSAIPACHDDFQEAPSLAG